MTNHNHDDLTPNAVVVIYTNEDDVTAVKHLGREGFDLPTAVERDSARESLRHTTTIDSTSTDTTRHDMRLLPGVVTTVDTDTDEPDIAIRIPSDWGDVVGSSTGRLAVHLKPLDSNEFCWRCAGVARQPGLNRPPTAATVR